MEVYIIPIIFYTMFKIKYAMNSSFPKEILKVNDLKKNEVKTLVNEVKQPLLSKFYYKPDTYRFNEIRKISL